VRNGAAIANSSSEKITLARIAGPRSNVSLQCCEMILSTYPLPASVSRFGVPRGAAVRRRTRSSCIDGYENLRLTVPRTAEGARNHRADRRGRRYLTTERLAPSNWPTTAATAPPRTSSRSSAPASPSRRTWPLPVDLLKIETTFVRELGTNVGDLAIVSCDHLAC
jgi:hypothetical protein